MPFFQPMANTHNVVVKRPDPSDIGSKKRYEILHDKLDVAFEESSELVTDREGSTRVITGRMVFPPSDRNYDVIDIQSDDKIEFDDYRGVRQERTVVRATPVFDLLGRLDIVVVEVE